MKKFMKTCYKCGADVKTAKCVKEGITLECLKCPKCGEEYFTSSELIKFDIKTGRRNYYIISKHLPTSSANNLPV